jgi:hypothetical protein
MDKRTTDYNNTTPYVSAAYLHVDKVGWADARKMLTDEIMQRKLDLNKIFVGNGDDLPAELLLPENSVLVRALGNVVAFQMQANKLLGMGATEIELFDTVLSDLNIGDFEGDFALLKAEANWVNNFSATPSFGATSLNFGQGNNGTAYFAIYNQSGWSRYYTDPYIKVGQPEGGTLIAWLTTDADWVASSEFIYTKSAAGSTYGDVGQKYYFNGLHYECIGITGTTRLWKRIGKVNTILINDITYLPYKVAHIDKADGSTFSVPANHTIKHLIYQNIDDSFSGDLIITDSLANVICSETVGNNTDEYFADLTIPKLVWLSSQPLNVATTGGVSVNIYLILQKV